MTLRNAVPRIVYLDQNAWVTLARGAWDKARYPEEHEALSKIIDRVCSGVFTVPLTFTNLYETSKVNVTARRANMALTQSVISRGRVFRSRRRILAETLATYLAKNSAILRPDPPPDWFLSDLWFESVADYAPETYGLHVSERVLDFIRQEPSRALFNYLAFNDEEARLEAVRRYTKGSADLIASIEARRALVAGQPLALKKRAYSARLIIDELDFIFATAHRLGLGWSTIHDIGPSLVRRIATDVPVLNVEREIAVRLEDQIRAVSENDLRDMMAFMTVLPLAHIVVAEKQFINLSRQANLDRRYGTKLLTSVFELLDDEGGRLDGQ